MSLKDDIKRQEGLRLKPYIDSVGKLTIGYGRNLDDVGISEAEANSMLDADLRIAINEVQRLFPWLINLSESRKNVIYNMAFNMGLPTLQKFKNMIAAINCGDYITAADEMLNSKWARQVGIRADELANIMRGS